MAARSVPVDGATIHVELDGDPGAPPILLFSGAACNSGMWTPVLPLLTPSFRVIRHDVRGAGRSPVDAGAQLGLDRFADDAAAVLDDLGVTRAVVWGMAFGSRVALAFAFRHPQRVKALALYDASVEAPDVGAQREGAAEAKRRRAELGIPEVDRDRGWFLHDDDATVRAGLAAVYEDPDHSRYAAGADMPVLVATGEFDPNLAASRRLAAMIPGSDMVVLPAVGHGSVMQRPDLCHEVLMSFLERRGVAGATGPGAG